MFEYVQLLFDVLVAQVRAVRDDDRGASALEWAIIAAVSVVMASLIGAIIFKIVNTKSTDIQRCGNQPVGVNC